MPRVEADWLIASSTQRVFDLLKDYQVFAVGGCIRNSLMGAPVKDVDMATDASPETVMELANAAGLRVIPTGIDHGTVTVVVDGDPFEVTTFRRDVETDGRRAVVAFSDRIEDDARRRDFTINAIYVDRDGVIHDPVDGLPDITERRIRFIENASQRIQEDYLRTLRFFRFSAYFSDPDAGFDAATLDAIAQNLDGLDQLSRERVGSEMKRLLAAPNPAPSVAVMRATGVLARILPGCEDRSLAPLIDLEERYGFAPDPLRRLAVLGGDIETLRLSRKELEAIAALRDSVGVAPPVLGYRLGEKMARDAVLITSATMATPIPGDAFPGVKTGSQAIFPVSAHDLMLDLSGKALGDKLAELENRWIESGFTLTKEKLLLQG